jgi:hypothetical protein
VSIDGQAKLVEAERDLDVVDAERATLEAAVAEVLGDASELLDVRLDTLTQLGILDLAFRQRAVVDDMLRVRVGKLDLRAA